MAWFSIQLREAQALRHAAHTGELSAQRFFAYLFTLPVECFLCDLPTCGPPICIMPDPTMQGWAILAPLCKSCATLMPEERAVREFAMAKAMWPRHRLVLGVDPRLQHARNRS
jgi:hypothetical protein